MGTLEVDKLDPQSGTALEIGTSGDTATVPSGATLVVAGTLNPSGTITAGTIAGSAIANDAIDSAHYADGSIDVAHMSANSVDSAQYVDGSIDLAHMSVNSIDSDQYVDGSIDLAHMSVNSIDSDQYVDGSIDNAHYAASSITTDKTSGVVSLNSKPLILNGNMAVAQRGTSTASITATNGYYTCDRMALEINSIGTWTQTQESLTSGNAFADGFHNAIKMDCTSADASLSAGDALSLVYRFEAQDLHAFKKGTASAETYTLSFWVKSTKTGTFIAEFYDHDNTRQVSKSYTVSSSDTWEKKVINYPADTTGALADDNGNGIFIYMYLGAGSTYTSGTLSQTWTSPTNGNRAAGQVNCADSTSNNFHLTGLQLEVGTYTSTTIPPFQHESYGDNLMRCRRYTQLHMDTDEDGGPFLGQCFAYTTSNWQSSLQLVPPMRTGPTVSSISGSNKYRIYSNGGTVEYDQIDLNSATDVGGTMCTVVDLSLDSASGGTAGYAGKTKGNSTGAGKMLVLEAEL